jgi:hypothetical protein
VEASATTFLDSVLSQWHTQEAALLNVGLRARILPNKERKYLGIEVEGPRHIASIQVWENACCLDIMVMDTASKESTWVCAGPCASLAEAHSRLAVLTHILLA